MRNKLILSIVLAFVFVFSSSVLAGYCFGDSDWSVYPDSGVINYIEYGPYCADGRNWRVADVDNDGYNEYFTTVGQTYRVWAKCEAKTNPNEGYTNYISDFLWDDVSGGCAQSWNGGDPQSKDYCGNKLEYAYNQQTFNSPQTSIRFPKMLCEGSLDNGDGYPATVEIGWNAGILKRVWNNGHEEPYMVLNCWDNSDCGTGKCIRDYSNPMNNKCQNVVCGDGYCTAGENCPADSGSCTDRTCYEPTCVNGCGEAAVPDGQEDEGCSGDYHCDGSGNCVEDELCGNGKIDEGEECDGNDDTRACGTDVGICEEGTQTRGCSSCKWEDWGECTGDKTGEEEKCYNDLDDDCDGEVDEECTGCGNGVCDLGETYLDCPDDCDMPSRLITLLEKEEDFYQEILDTMDIQKQNLASISSDYVIEKSGQSLQKLLENEKFLKKLSKMTKTNITSVKEYIEKKLEEDEDLRNLKDKGVEYARTKLNDFFTGLIDSQFETEHKKTYINEMHEHIFQYIKNNYEDGKLNHPLLTIAGLEYLFESGRNNILVAQDLPEYDPIGDYDVVYFGGITKCDLEEYKPGDATCLPKDYFNSVNDVMLDLSFYNKVSEGDLQSDTAKYVIAKLLKAGVKKASVILFVLEEGLRGSTLLVSYSDLGEGYDNIIGGYETLAVVFGYEPENYDVFRNTLEVFPFVKTEKTFLGGIIDKIPGMEIKSMIEGGQDIITGSISVDITIDNLGKVDWDIIERDYDLIYSDGRSEAIWKVSLTKEWQNMPPSTHFVDGDDNLWINFVARLKGNKLSLMCQGDEKYCLRTMLPYVTWNLYTETGEDSSKVYSEKETALYEIVSDLFLDMKNKVIVSEGAELSEEYSYSSSFTDKVFAIHAYMSNSNYNPGPDAYHHFLNPGDSGTVERSYEFSYTNSEYAFFTAHKHNDNGEWTTINVDGLDLLTGNNYNYKSMWQSDDGSERTYRLRHYQTTDAVVTVEDSFIEKISMSAYKSWSTIRTHYWYVVVADDVKITSGAVGDTIYDPDIFREISLTQEDIIWYYGDSEATINFDLVLTAIEGETVELILEMVDDADISYSISDPVGDDGIWETEIGDAGNYDVVVTVEKAGEVIHSFDVAVAVLKGEIPPEDPEDPVPEEPSECALPLEIQSLTPSQGTETTLFTYRVLYSGEPLEKMSVFIDDEKFDMELETEVFCFQEFCGFYKYETQLELGEHNYYFKAIGLEGNIKTIITDVMEGPTVTELVRLPDENPLVKEIEVLYEVHDYETNEDLIVESDLSKPDAHTLPTE